MRVSELVDLRLSSLDLEEAFAIVFGKGSKTRYIPAHPVALHAINEYLEAAALGNKPGDKNAPLFRPVKNNITGTLDEAIYEFIGEYQ